MTLSISSLMEIYANEDFGKKNTHTKQMNCSSDANMHRIHRWAALDQTAKGAGGGRGWKTEAARLAQVPGRAAHCSADTEVLVSPVLIL